MSTARHPPDDVWCQSLCQHSPSPLTHWKILEAHFRPLHTSTMVCTDLSSSSFNSTPSTWVCFVFFNTAIISLVCIFVDAVSVKTLKFYSLSEFQLRNRALSTVITMAYLSSSGSCGYHTVSLSLSDSFHLA